ncbi:MAG TPA: peroxiredoxin [Burkholderiales bacterium]|jgi:peroxiredoxin Q/BCP|nr:peroxiredoxin [Burkholderiales bacterium]
MVDQPAPDFALPATGGKTFRLSDAKGSTLVLYFYPKDNTPGCTREGEQFRDLHPDFRELRCEIYGVSRDSLKAHESFKSKMKFPFDLVSDTEETACRLFDVIKLKNMYGRKVRGIERSTFVIDARGIVRRAWRGVKVPDHAREVLEFVKTLK